jgi:hypothetical protein
MAPGVTKELILHEPHAAIDGEHVRFVFRCAHPDLERRLLWIIIAKRHFEQPGEYTAGEIRRRSRSTATAWLRHDG